MQMSQMRTSCFLKQPHSWGAPSCRLVCWGLRARDERARASLNHSSQVQGPGPKARTRTGGRRLGRAEDREEQSRVLAGSF